MAKKPHLPAKTAPKASILPETCTKAEFGALVGLTPRRVAEYQERGVLVVEKGRVVSLPSLHAYIGEMRKRAQGRSGGDGVDLAAERALLTRVQREREEIALSIDRGEVMALQDVAEGWGKFATVVKSSMLGLPTQLRAALGPHITAHDGQEIERVVRENLERMADELSAGSIPGANGADDLTPEPHEAPPVPLMKAKRRRK